MSKGLVVPDNPTPEDYVIVPFRIPNDPQWFGIIAGLLYSPCNGYWWRKSSGDWEAARDTMCAVASEFSMNLTEFCGQVELCIETNDGVREIIREIIRETTIGDPSEPLGLGIPSIDTCSPDHIFGAVTELVDYYNTVIIDTLEIIESATNVLEAANLWFDNQPIPTGALASKLIEAIDWIISTIAETYAANYTSTLRDKYRCDLFCIWTQNENCQLTMADVTSYFSGLVEGYDPFASYIDTLEYFVSEVWLGDEIPAVMHYLVSAAMSAIDAIGFFEFTGIKNYQTAIALGANNPDPDWSILCDECAPTSWCVEYDFAVSSGGWFVYNLAGVFSGTYVTGTGWKPVNVTGGSRTHRAVSIQHPIPAESTLTKVEIDYDYTIGTFVDTTTAYIFGSHPPQVDRAFTFNNEQPSGVDLLNTIETDISPENIFIFFRSSVRNVGQVPNGDVTVKRVRLYGTGDIPTGGNPC